MKRKNKINFALIKKQPAPGHPAQYRKKDKSGKIEFVSFTHSPEIDLNKYYPVLPQEKHSIITTEKLDYNINSKSKGTAEPSYAVPVVYEGDRNLLGSNKNSRYQITGTTDKNKIDKIFKTGMRIEIKKDKKE